MVAMDEDEYLVHYGILRRSGRYPWGSGSTQNVRNKAFLDYVAEQRAAGLSPTEIAQGCGITTTQLRAATTIASNQQRAAKINQALRLKERGYSNSEAARKMGIPEPTYRSYIAPGMKDKTDVLMNTAEMLRRQVASAAESGSFVDIGSGVEGYVGISKERLKAAVAILEEEGYRVHKYNMPQVGTMHDTKAKVLGPPGSTQKEAWQAQGSLKQISEFSQDHGHSEYSKIHPPKSISASRVGIKYHEDGGSDADGVIYVRRGVEDVSLGNARYAQVRVAVGKDHYLKGMAIYHDDMPPGVDLLFNTNKSDTGNKFDAMKKINHDDKDLPFGAVIKRQVLTDVGTTRERPSSVMNLVNEEGDWTGWSKNISSQVLSKQSPQLAKQQLKITRDNMKAEYDEIMSLTNPVVKQRLLEDFAESADAASVHLKAARLKRQNWHVILPVTSLKENEVFAPNYIDGEEVVAIRYPHGGTFEIPRLRVNNTNREGRRVIGSDAPDAIGIHPKVAERLSGADFDGDTVLLIPNNSGHIRSTPALQALKGFDPKHEYPAYEGMPKLSPARKQQLMGDVSNLINDMTLQKAPVEDIARAVKHSMVVIDAEKHHLNYKLSEEVNGIKQLKQKYQGSSRGGASTLISRKKSKYYAPERKLQLPRHGGPVDPSTGRLVYEPTNRTKTNKQGEKVTVLKPINKLSDTHDAHTLSSGTKMEEIYADHSNALKEMANRARLDALKEAKIDYSPSAKSVHREAVDSLNQKLAAAIANKPRERQAQAIAGAKIKAKLQANPHAEESAKKKIRAQALNEARRTTGAHKQRIQPTEAEWEAIQAGAISTSKLKDILNNSDMDLIRALATPRADHLMTTTKTQHAATLLAAGYTRAEVADRLGVSLTTLDVAMKEA